MKDMEYSYKYDDDGKYCYHESNVLKNKLNLRDLDVLHDAERELSMARYFDMENQGVTGDFSLEHMKSIHHYLFQDIYEWAGEIRTVDISKGTIFCLSQFISEQFNIVYSWLKKEKFLKEIKDKSEMSEKLAYLLGEINMIHPFREGNGRTQRMYLEQLCRLNGNFEINFSYVTKDEMIQASIDTSICRYESMTEIFNKCIIDRN